MKNFKDALLYLSKEAEEGSVTIDMFLKALSGKGKVLLVIILCIPFGQIPVVSIPIGFIIAYLGLRMAFFNNYVWIPAWILQKKIPSFFLKNSLKRLLRLFKRVAQETKPRYTWMTKHPITQKLSGIVLAIVGISLSLAPIIPFNSFIGFVAIFLISIGLLNDDEIYILLGYALALFYFVFVLVALKFFSIAQVYHFCAKMFFSEFLSLGGYR